MRSVATRQSEPHAAGMERALAWSVVAAIHALLFWGAAQLRVASSSDESSAPLALIYLPAPQPQRALPIVEPLPRTVAPKPLSSIAAPPRASAKTIASLQTEAESPTDAAAPTGLIAIEIPPSAPRTPWDAPTVNAFDREPPPLPGQGAQRFKMAPPRSLASTVENIGRLFGGRGEDPCARTRDNIRELGVQGDSAALQREVDYERRYCRP